MLSLCFGLGASSALAEIPQGRTSAAQLGSATFRHHHVLTIAQDFHPNDDYVIAVDAWTAQGAAHEISEVRLWWLDTGKASERSPFGRGVLRHINIDYARVEPGHWSIGITQGRRVFRFDVHHAAGGVRAFADVAVGETLIPHCQVKTSKLVARTLLGIPTGLKRFDVTCVDQEGETHRGQVQPRRR